MDTIKDNEADIKDFLSLIDEDKLEGVIQYLTENTQKKFNSSLSDEKVDELMMELRAIAKLRELFTGFLNNKVNTKFNADEEIQ